MLRLSALACALLAGAALPDDPTEGLPRAEARPAPTPYPRPPGIERPDGEAPPGPVALAPDAATVGRMPEAGTVARFDFEAEEGALSLFEMTAWGYARGWTSSSRMVVLDAAGTTLASSDRDGGTVYTDVLPFVAPSTGAYALEVSTVESGFRYQVVRHAGYPKRAADVTYAAAVEDAVVHQWIGARGDRVRFRVLGEPGERIVLRAEPTNERGRKHKRGMRRRLAIRVAAGGDLANARERMGARGRDDGSFPDLVLDVSPGGTGGPRIAGSGHVAVVRVPDTGWLDVSVARSDEGAPGLFDLAIERGVAFQEVRVRVGDQDDDPLAGVRVALFQEPGLDLVGRGVTGEEGGLVLDVPVGDYTVVQSLEGAKAAAVRTRIEGGELNLVLSRD
ncbi:MAG: hypothetical protein AAF957_24435 [Planctomycetota bacterium]